MSVFRFRFTLHLTPIFSDPYKQVLDRAVETFGQRIEESKACIDLFQFDLADLVIVYSRAASQFHLGITPGCTEPFEIGPQQPQGL